MIAIDAFAGRSIFQIAFVVNNLETALERYSTALNSGPWRCYTLGAEGHEGCDYRGGATSSSMPAIEFVWPEDTP